MSTGYVIVASYADNEAPDILTFDRKVLAEESAVRLAKSLTQDGLDNGWLRLFKIDSDGVAVLIHDYL